MADIKIYGRLVNDTDGVLATANQIVDAETGKTMSERMAEIESKAEQSGNNQNVEYYTTEEINNILNSI